MSTDPIEKRTVPDIMHGYIIDKDTMEPILWVNLNVTGTDETSLTDDNGEFKILFWKKTPVTVNIEHKNFEPIRLSGTCTDKRLLIMLNRRYR